MFEAAPTVPHIPTSGNTAFLRSPPRLLVLPFLAVALLWAGALRGQTMTTARLTGLVVDPAGQPLSNVLTTVSSADLGVSLETTTDASGRFLFALLGPGAYEVRAEAFGFRPVLARPVVLAAGEARSVTLPMAPATPPITAVDTVDAQGLGWPGRPAGGARVSSAELADLPFRLEDLGTVSDLASSLGGLPAGAPSGSGPVYFVDGIPLPRAVFPLGGPDQVGGFAGLPRSSLSGLTAWTVPSRVEELGSAGGVVAVQTRAATRDGGVQVEAGWSGDPLWSSGVLDLEPSLLSFHGNASSSLDVSPGGPRLVLSGDVLRHELPIPPRVTEALASGLAGLDAELLASLSSESTEVLSRYSALARFEAPAGSNGRLLVRALGGYTERTMEGPGAVALDRAAGSAERATEYSLVGAFTRALRPGLSFELRGGISGSHREAGQGDQSHPEAFLVDSATPIGSSTLEPRTSSRVDLNLVPALDVQAGPGAFTLGAAVRVSRHSLGEGAFEERFYADPDALVQGRGHAVAHATSEASFVTSELGAFLQYALQPRPDLRLLLGTRFDYESLPADDVALDAAWLEASGLRNDEYPSSFGQVSGLARVSWEPTMGTRVSGAFAAQHGDLDPWVVASATSQGAGTTTTTFTGVGLAWPGGALPAGATPLPRLTLIGPDSRAPRTLDAEVSVVQRVVGGLSVLAKASYRRTDFVLRRRDLNAPVIPRAVDAYGAEIFGDLQQDGGRITATPASRRFPGFGEAWALDSDGLSIYRAVTGGVEYAGERGSLRVAYTRSETRDNLRAAAGGATDADLPPGLPDEDWADGTSDFDAPHRLAATATLRLPFVTLSGVYRYSSGRPFTPGYRDGVDANGDGSARNDVPYVDAALVGSLLSDWPCLEDQVGGFAVRNSCRGPSTHALDLRLSVELGRVAGRRASLVLDAFNLVEPEDGVIDRALLLVDPEGSIGVSGDGSTITLPLVANPGFGRVLHPSTRGRLLRVGFRIG